MRNDTQQPDLSCWVVTITAASRWASATLGREQFSAVAYLQELETSAQPTIPWSSNHRIFQAPYRALHEPLQKLQLILRKPPLQPSSPRGNGGMFRVTPIGCQ